MTNPTTRVPAMQEAVLTDDELKSIIIDAHVSHGAFKTGYGLSLGRAIESALLSKLRAPVVDEQAALSDNDLMTLARDNGICATDQADMYSAHKGNLIDFARAALASAPVAEEAQEDLAPPKCPITGRPFFMALEHPELGMVPTYGGPYDSYTIPHLDGKPDRPWHERELYVYRYDHDLGGWRTDEVEVIPLRIVHEDVLHGLVDAAPQASEAVRPEIQAILAMLDVPVLGYLGSHSGKLAASAEKVDSFESAIPLVSESAHRAACEKIIAALPAQPPGKPGELVAQPGAQKGSAQPSKDGGAA